MRQKTCRTLSRYQNYNTEHYQVRHSRRQRSILTWPVTGFKPYIQAACIYCPLQCLLSPEVEKVVDAALSLMSPTCSGTLPAQRRVSFSVLEYLQPRKFGYRRVWGIQWKVTILGTISSIAITASDFGTVLKTISRNDSTGALSLPPYLNFKGVVQSTEVISGQMNEGTALKLYMAKTGFRVKPTGLNFWHFLLPHMSVFNGCYPFAMEHAFLLFLLAQRLLIGSFHSKMNGKSEN